MQMISKFARSVKKKYGKYTVGFTKGGSLKWYDSFLPRPITDYFKGGDIRAIINKYFNHSDMYVQEGVTLLQKFYEKNKKEFESLI